MTLNCCRGMSSLSLPLPPCFRYNKIKPLDESTRNSVTPLLTSTREDEDEEEEEEGNAHL
jgi:hypothetical protein